MRIVVAPQEFKGSLTAVEAAAHIARGLLDALPSAQIDEAPASDGGPGFVAAMHAAIGGELLVAEVHDPLMRPLQATWARLPNGVAVIEMAAAAGLVLLDPHERDPLRATTFGVGELILDALNSGCETAIVGSGGSATVDAGADAMRALGARLLDAAGDELPPGGAALARLQRIDLDRLDERLADMHVRVAVDVLNVLCGADGASAMFAPQKGASPEDVPRLEAALSHFADVVLRDLGVDLRLMPGSGSAGGLPCGLAIAAEAEVERGFSIYAEAADLESRISRADAVVTGEGRLDDQTGHGKTVAGVAELAARYRKPVYVIAGSIVGTPEETFAGLVSATPDGISPEDAMRDASRLLRDAGRRLGALLRA